MRIFLATIGSAGDVYPCLGLGAALRKRGHRVTLVTNERFAPEARREGLEFAALGTAEQYRAAVESPDLLAAPLRALRHLADHLLTPAVRPLYRVLAEARAREGGEEIAAAATPFALGARLAQERLGVPLATLHLQPLLLGGLAAPSLLPSWIPPALGGAAARAAAGLFGRVLAPGVNALRTELDLPPLRAAAPGWWNSPRRMIGLFPAWYAGLEPDWPPQARLTGFLPYDPPGAERLTVDAEAFLDAGPPPLVFFAGSANPRAAGFFRASAEACERLGRRGILLASDAGVLPPELPAGVRHFPYQPLSRLLPGAAALVHHGGIGTAARALEAGTPQLVVPFGLDQPDTAARVTRVGAGLALPPMAYRTGAAAELERLLNSAEIRARCAEIAGWMREGGDPGEGPLEDGPLEATCRLVEGLAEPRRGG